MKEPWTIEKIKEGFERFKIENGRLPIAPEIDHISYLPSARQIQRKFGGLEKLRTLLGYKDVHFGKGVFRSVIATRSNIRGRQSEIALEKTLRDKFGEVFVHTEKVFGDYKNRVDFFIYCPEGNFGIDIFNTDTMRDLQKNINLKIDKYLNFPYQLFFVIANEEFKQIDLDKYMLAKRKSLPSNTKIITIPELLNFIENKSYYPNPLK
jgi:hypothetical protein